MDLKDNKKSEWERLIKSLSFAIQGIKTAYFSERNLQIHTLFSILVIICGFYFQITKYEWLIIILLIGGMIAFELFNTAVEKVVDLVTKDFHPLAKKAKDIAAGAVFIYALTSVVIGLVLFLPYLIG
ncbi:diacylglycerol kinase family protein [Fredinandcohnia humi]